MTCTIAEVGYPFHCPGSTARCRRYSRVLAARQGRSTGGRTRLFGWDRAPWTPVGLTALGRLYPLPVRGTPDRCRLPRPARDPGPQPRPAGRPGLEPPLRPPRRYRGRHLRGRPRLRPAPHPIHRPSQDRRRPRPDRLRHQRRPHRRLDRARRPTRQATRTITADQALLPRRRHSELVANRIHAGALCDLPHLPITDVEDAVTRCWSTHRHGQDFSSSRSGPGCVRSWTRSPSADASSAINAPPRAGCGPPTPLPCGQGVE
jgi:hypothetical protein